MLMKYLAKVGSGLKTSPYEFDIVGSSLNMSHYYPSVPNAMHDMV